jgi:hypothetical protein
MPSTTSSQQNDSENNSPIPRYACQRCTNCCRWPGFVKLTDSDRQSAAISAQVAPMVHDEVLAAQSAHVSNISGGTYTTQGYLQSLQAALDAAGFTG